VAPNVALLFGIPTTQAEFLSRVSESDWLSKFYDRDLDPVARQRSVEYRWANEYLPLVADPIRELVDVASKYGVEVRTKATLSMLSEATDTREIVILFAHWKGSEILHDDFILPISNQSFVASVQECRTPLCRWMLGRFREIGLFGATAPTAAERILSFWRLPLRHRSSLREVLTEALATRLPADQAPQPVDEILEHEATRSARRRDELDIIFKSLLRSGNRLELFDGLHCQEEVETAVSPSFEGILDLTTCTSTVLADYLSSRRGFRFNLVQVPTVQEVVWAANCVKGALTLAITEDVPFLEARLLVSRALEQAVKEESSRRGARQFR
jgi:hypothetical protein